MAGHPRNCPAGQVCAVGPVKLQVAQVLFVASVMGPEELDDELLEEDVTDEELLDETVELDEATATITGPLENTAVHDA